SRIHTFLDSSRGHSDLTELLDPFEHGWTQLTELTDHLKDLAVENREVLGAVAPNYLKHFALTVLGYTWCRQVKYAIVNDSAQQDVKYKTARYFFDMIFPQVDVLATRVKRGKEPMMMFDTDEF
ncbi:MAG: acyl-CoA dehydrogenase C-terminal domain-containing protein, partial [Bradymonadaceae bacterium]